MHELWTFSLKGNHKEVNMNVMKLLLRWLLRGKLGNDLPKATSEENATGGKRIKTNPSFRISTLGVLVTSQALLKELANITRTSRM